MQNGIQRNKLWNRWLFFILEKKFWLTFSLVIIKFKLNKVLPCDLNPGQCQNGGLCLDDYVGGFTCTCLNGYTGGNCEIRNRILNYK